jgi:carboxypeptidase Taq
MTAHEAYHELLRWSREQALLSSCHELLSWDEETYMPPGGVENRSRQLAFLAGLEHERATNPRLANLFAAVDGSDLVSDPLSPEAVNVREWRRDFDRLTRLPRSLVEETAAVTSLAQLEWASARKNADFEHFRPWLERIVSLKRREAEALQRGGELYDALLDDYEPGATSADLSRLFAELRRDLVPLATSLTHAERRPNLDLLRREFPVDRQRFFAETTAATLGFDFERGRLDTTVHPFFSCIGPGDCRLTTRFHATEFADGFFGTLHEVGHGLYEQGLDADHAGTPVGDAPSIAVHESQARLWENSVGRSRGFWRHFYPHARQVFREALGDVSFEDFLFAVNAVEATLIRVQADEVTYNLHILIRFELERALLSGELPVGELPAAWNRAYQHHLGVVPENDAEGCLQDGHWASGQFGYFPTYTLGNVYAAQLLDAAERDCGSFVSGFTRGDFGGLLAWLRASVHGEGGRYPAAALIEHVTGAQPNPSALIERLKRKYRSLYRM